MHRFIVITMLCIPFCGCITRTVSSPQLDARVAKHAHETINWLDYMGTKDGFHYIRHSYTLGSRTYRVPIAQMHVSDTFPVTRDSSRWRPLMKHRQSWPPELIPAFEVPSQIQKE